MIIAIGWSSFVYGQEDWMPYRSPEGQFRIATQGIFKKSVTHAKTGIGSIDINTFVFPKEPKAEEKTEEVKEEASEEKAEEKEAEPEADSKDGGEEKPTEESDKGDE